MPTKIPPLPSTRYRTQQLTVCIINTPRVPATAKWFMRCCCCVAYPSTIPMIAYTNKWTTNGDVFPERVIAYYGRMISWGNVSPISPVILYSWFFLSHCFLCVIIVFILSLGLIGIVVWWSVLSNTCRYFAQCCKSRWTCSCAKSHEKISSASTEN